MHQYMPKDEAWIHTTSVDADSAVTCVPIPRSLDQSTTVYSVSQKIKIPLRFSDIFSQTVENF